MDDTKKLAAFCAELSADRIAGSLPSSAVEKVIDGVLHLEERRDIRTLTELI
jgi:hypothetical protein